MTNKQKRFMTIFLFVIWAVAGIFILIGPVTVTKTHFALLFFNYLLLLALDFFYYNDGGEDP